MEIESILKILALVLGTGGIATFWTYKSQRAKTDQVSFQTLLNQLNADNKELRQEIKVMNEKYMSLQTKTNSLLSRMSDLESAHNDLPIPQWLKDKFGIMLSLNKAYEKVFLDNIGKSKSEYIGYTDFEVWPEATAEKFTADDRKVLSEGIAIHMFEDIDFGSHIETWMVLKYPRFSDGVIIGIGGIAYKKIKNEVTKEIEFED